MPIYPMKKHTLLCLFCTFACVLSLPAQRKVYNFNSAWQLGGQTITLPHAWNEDEAYARPIAELSDSVVTYTKTFRLPSFAKGDRVLLEFEGARQAAEVFVNGQRVAFSEDGICAFGADITEQLTRGDEQVSVVTDNSWTYHERSTGSRFQWNDRNFNVNYGGLTKNVRLHVVPSVYQTLPLLGSLGTTGQYIYASDIDVAGRSAVVHVESQVCNTGSRPVRRRLVVVLEDRDGREVARFRSPRTLIAAGDTCTLSACRRVDDLHFWSWGYGYLYKVHTLVGKDEVVTTTGFRKAEYKQGMVWLNDRVLQIHGYAQRSSNEWPGVGVCVPPWLSDYGNRLCVQGGGNLVRWMHICPSKQEIESCDRVGLIEAMPAGDAESDVNDIRWEQRKQVMRNAIVYNRNNPSILFYECGNKGISETHMEEMKAIRDCYDPYGMRAIGSREMLDSDVAEYGGEMLYVNKSTDKPLWMMEYCRDESLRKYWNAWTPVNDHSAVPSPAPVYHPEGYGPLYKNADASPYNHNSDAFAVELVRRWYDYWLERPGTSDFVNAGGAKIIFSDTHTHCRSEMNYRLSGVVDAMRIPKDGYWAHQVMWNGWVDDLAPQTYICGHWNYGGICDTIPAIYVISSDAEAPVLTVNGCPVPIIPDHQYRYLYTYRNVPYVAGELKATAPHSSYSLHTAGAPAALRLTPIVNPLGWRADGADVALVEMEVVDADGRRCPLDNRPVTFTLSGPAEWRGGIAQVKPWQGTDEGLTDKYVSDNYALSTVLPVEAGVGRVMLRSATTPGTIQLTAHAPGLPDAALTLTTHPFPTVDGLSAILPADGLRGYLDRGETPATPSFVKSGRDVSIVAVEAGSNADDAPHAIDRNERTTWVSSPRPADAWITFTLSAPCPVDELVMKMGDWRNKSYPIEVVAGTSSSSAADTIVWRGSTPKSLSYVHIPLGGVVAKRLTVRLVGAADSGDAFGAVQELDARNNETMAAGNGNLRIVEAQLIEKIVEK